MRYKKPFKILGHLFLFFLLAGTGPLAVRAQEKIIQPVPNRDSTPRPIPEDRTPSRPAVEIDGDRMDYDMGGNKLIVSGHVSLRRGTTELFCDKLEYFRSEGYGIAEGNVVLMKDGSIITGEKMKNS